MTQLLQQPSRFAAGLNWDHDKGVVTLRVQIFESTTNQWKDSVMDNLQIKAMLAGLFFGIWPLLMNKSGLNGGMSSMAFSGLVFALVAPFALKNVGDLTQIRWMLVILAGIAGAIGVMNFNGMLAKATPNNVGSLFITMIAIQIALPAIVQIIADRKIAVYKGLGIACAILAAIFLNKK